MSREFIEKSVKAELIKQGLQEWHAVRVAAQAADYFTSHCCNSKDPFKECCDHAGKIAAQEVAGFKYKSPKAPSARRQKRPQEAFKF